MKRRDFLMTVAAAAMWPVASYAQRPPVVGFLSAFTETQAAPALAAIRRGLGENGFGESSGLAIEARYANGQYDRLPKLVDELIQKPVDVIIASGRPAPFAAKAATKTVPIIFVVSLDPVYAGLVDSMNRPSGNVTGITHMSDPLVQKRLEIGLEMVPKASAVAVLVNPNSPDVIQEVRAIREMTQQRGLDLRTIQAKAPDEIDAAFASLQTNRPDLLLVTADPFFLSRVEQLVASAAQHAVPTVYPFSEFSRPGGLVAYGANRLHNYRQAGHYAARIVRGTKTTELPIMQPTLFEFVINLKTAKTLRLEVPPSLLARADQVIE
jgi:putative tryptophan/tyrosine transport system substrate-binding protein